MAHFDVADEARAAPPDDLRGSAFALLAAVQAFGNVIASSVAGLLYTVASPAAAFGFAAALMVIAVGSLAARRGDLRLRAQKRPAFAGLFSKRMKGLEPSTFCMASRRSSQLSYSREGAEYSRGLDAREGV